MKRLFTNLNVHETNEDFYKSVVEELKGCEWVITDSDKFLCESVPPMTFYKMTAIDFSYFENKNINFRYEIIYTKTVDNQYSWEVNFYEGEERQYSDYLLVENDDLGLFAETEELETMTLENLEAAINKFTPEEVAKLIENNCVDVYDAVRDIVLDNIGVNDLPEWLQEDAGKDWVENNLDDAKEKYLENASSSDLRDLAVEIINDYL